MKSLLIMLGIPAFALAFGACSPAIGPKVTPARWEYKTLSLQAANNDPQLRTTVTVDEAQLNALGTQGWRLVSSYEEYATVFPNFSADARIVTGIESNVRPTQVVLLFERPLP